MGGDHFWPLFLGQQYSFLPATNRKKKSLLGIAGSLVAIVIVFAYSGVLQPRLAQVEADIKLARQGKYDTSLGYRFALWDVGLHGIAEKPLFGQGTGAAESYFEKTVKTYKDGIYKDLPKYMETSHYHNDWIEIGMHIGALGSVAFAFFPVELVSNPEDPQASCPGSRSGMFYVYLRPDGYFRAVYQNSYISSRDDGCCGDMAKGSCRSLERPVHCLNCSPCNVHGFFQSGCLLSSAEILLMPAFPSRSAIRGFPSFASRGILVQSGNTLTQRLAILHDFLILYRAGVHKHLADSRSPGSVRDYGPPCPPG